MWPVNKVEIHFAKMGFMDSKQSDLNAQMPYTPYCHSFLGSTVVCSFLCMQEKGMLHVDADEVANAADLLKTNRVIISPETPKSRSGLPRFASRVIISLRLTAGSRKDIITRLVHRWR